MVLDFSTHEQGGFVHFSQDVIGSRGTDADETLLCQESFDVFDGALFYFVDFGGNIFANGFVGHEYSDLGFVFGLAHLVGASHGALLAWKFRVLCGGRFGDDLSDFAMFPKEILHLTAALRSEERWRKKRRYRTLLFW